MIHLLNLDVVTCFLNWCKRILNVWFVLRWPYLADRTLKFKNYRSSTVVECVSTWLAYSFPRCYLLHTVNFRGCYFMCVFYIQDLLYPKTCKMNLFTLNFLFLLFATIICPALFHIASFSQPAFDCRHWHAYTVSHTFVHTVHLYAPPPLPFII